MVTVEVRFDTDDESFQRYRTELRTDYPHQPASAAGYKAWRSALSEWQRTDPSTLDRLLWTSTQD